VFLGLTPIGDVFSLRGAADHLGPDNSDVRYVHAWGFAFSGSSVAPAPIAAAKIDGNAGVFAQRAAGLGVYAWLDGHLYAELSGYAASIPGGAHPLDSTQSTVIHGLAPYWRLAYEQRWDRNSISAGVFGMDSNAHHGSGAPLQIVADRFQDDAADVQYQFINGNHAGTLLATYIRESQTLNASVIDQFAENATNTLKTLKLTGEYRFQRKLSCSVGYFTTKGSADTILYAAAPLTGGANGRPDSSGYNAEVNYLPRLNVKLQLQYIGYERFNGLKTDYDGAGRSASDYSTLYGLVWLSF